MSLKIKSLSKSFDDKTVIYNLSYEFPERGLFGIVGESGIGKTTLLRIIAGLDNDYSGEVVGGGVGSVSFAFQEYRLFPTLTALENVVFAISKGKDKAVYDTAAKFLKSLGLAEGDLSLYPSELSGGMRQRVSLARALLKTAPILLLDEPTKELDSANCNRVLDLISKESKHRLVIMVSHNEDELRSLNATIINLAKQ